jgi:hypothetical protein
MVDSTVRERMTTTERLRAWLAEFEKQQGRERTPVQSCSAPAAAARP